MLKVNNKDTRTMPWTHSGVFVVNFEHAIAGLTTCHSFSKTDSECIKRNHSLGFKGSQFKCYYKSSILSMKRDL